MSKEELFTELNGSWHFKTIPSDTPLDWILEWILLSGFRMDMSITMIKEACLKFKPAKAMTTTILFTKLTEIQLCNGILIVKNPELSTTKLFLNVKMFKIRKIDEYTCELELTAYKNMKVIEKPNLEITSDKFQQLENEE